MNTTTKYVDSIKNTKRKHIVIFGFSNIGKLIYEYIGGQSGESIIFCDNDSKKHGKFGKYIIIPVDEAVHRYSKEACFLLASRYHFAQMKEQLILLGIEEEAIIDYVPESIVKEEIERIAQRSKTKLSQIQFEVSITKNCNLNCKSCDHFAPLAKNNDVYKYSEYVADIQQMSRIFNKTASQISILGGEPLLNNEIDKYLLCSREFFPEAKIRIITNGLLLKQMPQSFWNICVNNNIFITVTKYPIGIDYMELETFVRGHDVAYEYDGVSEATRTFWHEPLDLNGKQDITENFESCTFGNVCIVLDKGKLFPCIIPANIHLFNRYFHEELLITKKDYIDIYENTNPDEIVSFLAKPFPFCRYCYIKGRTYDHPFEISKKLKDEWIN